MFKLILICLIISLSSLSLKAYEKQKVALITGASRGVGFAIAELLASKGYKVYGTVRDNHIPTSQPIVFLNVDLKSQDSIENAFSFIIKNEGRIDVLINNAGYALVGPIETFSQDEIDEQMAINFLAPIKCIQASLPIMRRQKCGNIINISSINAFATPAFGSIYAASKSALESLSESLYAEVSPFNIKVSIIEPGVLKTDFSLKMGTKVIHENPYENVVHSIQQDIKNRSSHPYYQNGQSAQDIALFVWDVINEKEPKLRYQTSQIAQLEVSKKLKDLDGKIFIEQLYEATD